MTHLAIPKPTSNLALVIDGANLNSDPTVISIMGRKQVKEFDDLTVAVQEGPIEPRRIHGFGVLSNDLSRVINVQTLSSSIEGAGKGVKVDQLPSL
jgi:hypothetical protein